MPAVLDRHGVQLEENTAGLASMAPAGEPTCVISDNKSRLPSCLITTFLPLLVFSQFVLVALLYKCGIR